MEELKEILKKLNTGTTSDGRSLMEREQRKVDLYNEDEGTANEDGYDCPICKNRGDIAILEEYPAGCWRFKIKECKCAEIHRSIRRMEKSGLKNIIRDYTFGKFEATEPWQKTIKEAAMAYAKEPDGWFFIGGQSGAGKTHLCTAICREFLLAGQQVIYMLWRDEVVKLKAAVNDYEAYGKSIERYKNAEILYIDDMFKTGRGQDGEKQVPTGADVNVAYQILGHRYNEKLPTIISSECTQDDILDIDEALGGRIVERAVAFDIAPDRSRNYRVRKVIKI